MSEVTSLSPSIKLLMLLTLTNFSAGMKREVIAIDKKKRKKTADPPNSLPANKVLKRDREEITKKHDNSQETVRDIKEDDLLITIQSKLSAESDTELILDNTNESSLDPETGLLSIESSSSSFSFPATSSTSSANIIVTEASSTVGTNIENMNTFVNRRSVIQYSKHIKSSIKTNPQNMESSAEENGELSLTYCQNSNSTTT